MLRSTNKKLMAYFVSFTSVLILGLGYGGYQVWKKGYLGSEYVSTLYESNLILENLKSNGGAGRINKLVKVDNSRGATEVLSKKLSTAKRLNFVSNLPEFHTFEKSGKELKEVLNLLIEIPDFSSINNVLLKKVSNFNKFASSNNWRTLTRTSRRMLEEVKSKYNYRKIGYSTKKISSYYKFLDYQLKSMRRITLNSVLDKNEKTVIVARIDSFEKEKKLLLKYRNRLRSFDEKYKSYKEQYSNWVGSLSPILSLRKDEFESSVKSLSFYFIGFIALLIAGISGGFFFHNKDIESTNERIEERIIETIKLGIVSHENKMRESGSEHYERQFHKYRDYVQKRMSFGSIFRDALPFASILLDSNLHLLWGNDLFFEQWGLENEKIDEEKINWDFLQRFTNLGEDDPVLQAIKNKLAGIYQIQVRLRSEETMPFEMYVSPIEYNGTLRVMIFFYPLRNLEDTLNHQVKSIVGPVSRTLNSIIDDSLSGEFLSEIKKDFEIAGIENLHKKFSESHEKELAKINSLLEQIEALENELFDVYKISGDMKVVHRDTTKRQENFKGHFSGLKDGIISQVGHREEKEKLIPILQKSFKEVHKECRAYGEQAIEANNLLKDNVDSIRRLIEIRDELKTTRNRSEDFRKRILQSVDQTMILKRTKSLEMTDLEIATNKIKMEIKGFEEELKKMSQLLTNLDVSLSKTELVVGGNENLNLKINEELIGDAHSAFEDTIFEIERNGQTSEKVDGQIIESLKKMYEDFQTERKSSQVLAMLDEKISINLEKEFSQSSSDHGMENNL